MDSLEALIEDMERELRSPTNPENREALFVRARHLLAPPAAPSQGERCDYPDCTQPKINERWCADHAAAPSQGERENLAAFIAARGPQYREAREQTYGPATADIDAALQPSPQTPAETEGKP